jgi:type I restriction enzyme S subunit
MSARARQQWPLRALGECGDFLSGGTPSRGRQDYWNGSIPWISAKSLKSFHVTDSEERVTEEGAKNGTRIVPAGTVLFVVRGMSLAKEFRIGVSARPVAFNQDLRALIPSPDIDARYLGHFLRSSEAVVLGLVDQASHGTTRLTSDRVEALGVPIPPLREQRRIAELLDRGEALRAKRRVALALLDDLESSTFVDLFGDPVRNERRWKRIPFGQILSSIDSGWSPTCLDRPAQAHEWGVLKLGSITSCEFDSSENKALPADLQPDPNIEVGVGDLLFSRKNTYNLVAACAFVRETRPRLMMSDLIFRLCLRSDAGVEPRFIQQLLVYPSKRREVQKLAGGSSESMPNISKSRLQGATVELPPLPLQQEFARRIAAVEKLKTAHRASLVQLDALFASLQHRAFRGEL